MELFWIFHKKISTSLWIFYGFALKYFIIFRNFCGIRINTCGIIIKIVCIENSEDRIVSLSPKEFGTKVKSKMNLERLLSINLDLFLPIYRCCPTRLLRQLLSGEKKVLLVTDVEIFDVSQYYEL